MSESGGRFRQRRSLQRWIHGAESWAKSRFSDPAREIAALRSSGLFDAEFYIAGNPGTATTPEEALQHYVTLGSAEGRDPNRLFRESWYAAQLPRLLAGQSGLMHYLTKGAARGLDPNPLFDTSFYVRRNPDVAAASLNPLQHYLQRGAYEGCDPHPLFDSDWYLSKYPDVAASKTNPLAHYLERGWKQGREPHPLFDTSHLSRTYGYDPKHSVSALEFFCDGDLPKDADPSALFHSALYRYQLEVERGVRVSARPILHYLEHGHRDLTLFPNLLFDPQYYVANNDVPADTPALVHYRVAGDAAGYATHPFFDAGIYNAGAPIEGGHSTAIAHYFQSPISELRVSRKQMTRPISKSILGAVRKIIDADYEVDLDTYLEMYPSARRDAVLKHYRDIGSQKGRRSELLKLIKDKRLRIADMPLGFYHDEYARLNPDVQEALGDEFLPLFMHYLRHGREEGRAAGEWQFYVDLQDYAIASPHPPSALPAPSQAGGGVCLLLHIYYADLLPELVSYANSFGPNVRDVFINVVDTIWTPELHARIRELCPGAFVILSRNAGRDIGGFIRLLENVDFGRYELFAFMHTKRSPHIAKEKAEFWRRKLLNAFAGNSAVATRSIEAFRSDPRIGMLGSKDWRGTDIAANAENFEKMLDLFGIEEPNRGVEYLSGSMFLIRPEIVRHLFQTLKDLEFESGDGGNLAFNMDGQLAHAVERVIGNVVRQLGYRIEWVES